MYKIGVIGGRDIVPGFRSIGLDVFPCSSSEDAAKTVHRLAGEDYAIVYITEELASEITEDIDRYKEQIIHFDLNVLSDSLQSASRRKSQVKGRAEYSI